MLEFWGIWNFLIGGIIFVLLGTGIMHLLAPKKPNPEKLSTYESGEVALSMPEMPLQMRFYVLALVFLIFEVEILFLFPWATVFAEPKLIKATPTWGWMAAIEMLFFVAILLLGLIYVWRKGDLDWEKPDPKEINNPSQVPVEIYDKVNKRYK